MTENEEKRRKWCLLIIVALLIAFLAFSLAQNAQNTADINNVFAPVPNNTNLAPDFSGIDPSVPFGTGERIQNTTYNATNYSLDLHVFAHAMTVSDTASVKVYIDGVLVSPRSGRPLGAAETAYRGVDITIPKNSSYLVNITNYHHYEWREYPILAGKNGTLSLNQTFITNGSSFNATYDQTTKEYNANYSSQTFPNSTIITNSNNIAALQKNDSYFNGTVFPNSTNFRNDSINDTIIRNYTAHMKAVTTTHDVSITGNQAITGAGFKPSGAIVFSTIPNTNAASWGILEDGNDMDINTPPNAAATAGNFEAVTSRAIVLVTGTNVYATASVASFDTDGITITWTKNGAPTGTATLVIMFFR